MTELTAVWEEYGDALSEDGRRHIKPYVDAVTYLEDVEDPDPVVAYAKAVDEAEVSPAENCWPDFGQSPDTLRKEFNRWSEMQIDRFFGELEKDYRDLYTLKDYADDLAAYLDTDRRAAQEVSQYRSEVGRALDAVHAVLDISEDSKAVMEEEYGVSAKQEERVSLEAATFAREDMISELLQRDSWTLRPPTTNGAATGVLHDALTRDGCRYIADRTTFEHESASAQNRDKSVDENGVEPTWEEYGIEPRSPKTDYIDALAQYVADGNDIDVETVRGIHLWGLEEDGRNLSDDMRRNEHIKDASCTIKRNPDIISGHGTGRRSELMEDIATAKTVSKQYR